MNDTRTHALGVLRTLVGRDDADFHEGQFDAISALVDERQRALVVQRTGWGKSAVYFVATLLLRQRGAGPTVLVSPLLALMRDQIAAARRLGIRAHTINSTNRDAWEEVEALLGADAVDLLLISPERLNNPQFRARMLPRFAERVGLLVVDEAHCVSQWGHDFRPDYFRLADAARWLGAKAILALTATATPAVAPTSSISPWRSSAWRSSARPSQSPVEKTRSFSRVAVRVGVLSKLIVIPSLRSGGAPRS